MSHYLPPITTNRYEINLTPALMALGALQCWGVCGIDVQKITFLNIEQKGRVFASVRVGVFTGTLGPILCLLWGLPMHGVAACS